MKTNLNIRELKAELLKRGILERPVGDETIYRWLRAGYFEGAQKGIGLPGQPWRIPESAIDTFLDHYRGEDDLLSL